ncbi:MAG: hypothetical protein ACREBF_03510 [Candidatus Micrarchaeales archaeon]
MVTAQEVIDEHFGLIDKTTAAKIAQEKSTAQNSEEKDVGGAKPILTTVNQLILEKIRIETLVDIEETVYRVYNKKEVEINGADIMIRMIVLGTQGENARLILFREKAELATSIPIERGDRILVNRAVVKRGYNGFELASISQSAIEVLKRANTGINDFNLIDDRKEVDVLGKVVSIGPIKHSIFSANRDSDSCSFTITDGINQLGVSAIGNAVRDIAAAHPGDVVKIEFAIVKEAVGKKELYVNESGRILVNESLRSRLQK